MKTKKKDKPYHFSVLTLTLSPQTLSSLSFEVDGSDSGDGDSGDGDSVTRSSLVYSNDVSGNNRYSLFHDSDHDGEELTPPSFTAVATAKPSHSRHPIVATLTPVNHSRRSRPPRRFFHSTLSNSASSAKGLRILSFLHFAVLKVVRICWRS
ncbi:hypothetical protein RIF29_20757 [Crotalaria pallida]|uniref:Uncharacterized protein n=1 Tax=Crotalaria pallida TaxID=3830 RepID=A0AAN9F384_CROPI